MAKWNLNILIKLIFLINKLECIIISYTSSLNYDEPTKLYEQSAFKCCTVVLSVENRKIAYCCKHASLFFNCAYVRYESFKALTD